MICVNREKRQLRNVYARGVALCEYLCAMDDVGAMTEISKWKPHIAHTLAGNTIGITTKNYIYT